MSDYIEIPQTSNPITAPTFDAQTLEEGCQSANEASHGRLPADGHQTHTALRQHGKQNLHSPYACLCDRRFSCLDVLLQHIREQTDPDKKFLCIVCGDAFHRREHLKQHLEHKHKQIRGQDNITLVSRGHEVEPGLPTCNHYDDTESHGTAPALLQQPLPYAPAPAAIPGPNPGYLPCPMRDCGFSLFDEETLNEHIFHAHGLVPVNQARVQVNQSGFSPIPAQAMPIMNMQQTLVTEYAQQSVYNGHVYGDADPILNNEYLDMEDFNVNMDASATNFDLEAGYGQYDFAGSGIDYDNIDFNIDNNDDGFGFNFDIS
ncbi:hypothetical protein F5Y16DRAFT_419055 [Xylariaceae sp. FL0255]|nr:hypothetical protein F5Y16DRAFT_419055 [Xylariaceae sp. FL0255]